MSKCLKDVMNNNACTVGAISYVHEDWTIILCMLSVCKSLFVRAQVQMFMRTTSKDTELLWAQLTLVNPRITVTE